MFDTSALSLLDGRLADRESRVASRWGYVAATVRKLDVLHAVEAL